MQTLQTIKRKIDTAEDLLSVVKTMKSLAAVTIRQFQEAAAAMDEYDRVVALAWKALFGFHGGIAPAGADSRAVCLAIGSDQGMCGQFNEAAMELALAKEKELTGQGLEVTFWTSGERLRLGLLDSGVSLDRHFDLPGGPENIGSRIREIVEAFDQNRRKTGGETLVAVYNREARHAGYETTSQRILPLDEHWLERYAHQPWESRSIPSLGLPPADLFHSLFRQYLFVSLSRAFAQSLASENGARLASMQAAERNIDELKEGLTGKYRETRQNTITEELFDIIAGFEAVGGQAE